ncbi:alpha/beta hydrolase [Burkholderiales bacterium]|nr:alpha/beta hydrolase [Burkholderiales bacterium]
MFKGFELKTIEVNRSSIRLRIGGEGPPLLLLHGNPQTHVMWHSVAPKLSKRFTIVAADLTGYGDSYKPQSSEDHSAYSKRSMANDQVNMMLALGFETFSVAGHDRGGRVAYRMALDHPSVVEKLAVLDIIPTLESFQRCDTKFSLGYYHWFFLAQPSPFPETLINENPERFWRWHTNRVSRDFFTQTAVEDYLRCFRNPETVRAICEDYRAAVSIDCEHDLIDQQNNHKITCPVLALWGKQAKLEQWYDTIEVWRAWATQVEGYGIDCGHYLAEEEPEQTTNALSDFF